MRSAKKASFLFLRHLVVVFLIWLIGGFPTLVFALPQDGQIVAGSGSITEPTSTSMQVDQNTNQMIINWNSFSIGAAESVNFSQPGTGSIALNRVIGADPSLLLGNLTANGQVFITNGSGVFFGPGSHVDTHGLIATTMAISDQDFLDQNYNFTQDIDNPLTAVINEGTISATSYVGLLAPAVENRGTIVVASLGSVDLAAGKAATLDFTGDGLISFELTEAVAGTVTDKDGNVLEDRVSNRGLIQADGGQVRMSAKDAGDVIRHVVNMEGTIVANTVVEKEGRVFLTGGSSGAVNVSGTITASGDDAGEIGGTVHVLGEKVGLFDNAVVNVSGDAGGGTALIGGDYQGKNPDIQNANRTYVGEGAVINASAGTTGNGGKVIVWADDVTRFYGSILATGGLLSGDGGFAEVSGKASIDFHAYQIELSAANGGAGTLLLDPANITLLSGVDANSTGFTAGSDNTEAFADDSGLTTILDIDATTGSFVGVGNGTTIELQATGDITVSNAWNVATSTGNTNVSVVLRAGNDININQVITVSGTGTLTLEADGNTADGAGDIVFGASGSLVSANQSIDLTANDLNLTTGSINAGTGTVTILVSDAGTIGLGDTAGGMSISGAELQNITAANVSIGDSTAGNITVDNITLANTANISTTLTLTTGGDVAFNTTVSAITNNLAVSAVGDITQGFGLSVGGTSSITVTGTNVATLTNSSNDFTGAITLSSGTGAVQLTDSTATILAASTLGGNLTVTSSAAMTQTGALSVTGNSSFASTGGDITLSTGTNDLGANLTLDTNNSFNVATTSTLTDLTLTVDPANTSTYAMSAANISAFNLTDSTTTIDIGTLTATALNFSLTTDSGSVTTSGAMDVGTGSFAITTNSSTDGAITISQTLAAGALTLDANGTLADVSITNAVTIASGGAVTLTADDTINFGASGSLVASGTGNVSIQSNTDSSGSGDSGDAITMSSGSVINAGSGTLTLTSTGTGAGNITIGELITTSSSNSAVTLTSATNVSDGNGAGTNVSAVNGRLVIDATTGVGSADALEIAVASVDIDNTTSNSIGLTETDALIIANMTSANQINLTTSGAITQSGAITAVGTSTFAAGISNNITLDDSSNDFSTVIITTGYDVTLTDANSLILGASDINNSIAVIAGGDITQTAQLSVANGTSSFTVTGSNVITLTQNNTLAGAVTLSSGTGAVQITELGTLTLAASTLGGDLTASADDGLKINGDLTTTGNMILEGDANDSFDGIDNIELASGITLTAGGNMTLDATTSGISTLGALTVNATNAININDDLTSSGSGTHTFNADSDADGTGDFTVASGKTLSTTNDVLSIKGANLNFSSATVTSGSAGTTLTGTTGTTIDGTSITNLTAATLTINATGNLIVDGLTSAELSGVSGLLTLTATDDVIFQTAASSHNGAVTVKADDDIEVKVDVTAGGNFTATADNDSSGAGNFTVDSGATVTSSSGNISITAFEIVENGTLTASISGSVTRTETKPVTSTTTTAEEAEIDQGTNSTFVQDFTSPTESGC